MDESFSCSLLDGHTDIVLSVDASPTGYVTFQHYYHNHDILLLNASFEAGFDH